MPDDKEKKPQTFEDIFKASQEKASSTGKNNIWLGILKSAITEDPSHIFNAISQNDQMHAKAAQAQQFMQTPEFKSIDPHFQNLAADFAGSGDIGHAFEMVTAGRTSKKRLDDEAKHTALLEAIQKFPQDQGQAYKEVLKEQNPQAYATMYEKEAREVKENAQNTKTTAKDKIAQIKSDKEASVIGQSEASMNRIKGLNLSPADYNASPEDLEKRGLSKQDVETFINARNRMAEKGKGFEASNPAVGTVRDVLHQYVPSINPGQKAISPQEFFNTAIPATMNPEMVQKYQQQQGQIQGLQGQIEQADQDKQAARVYTKPPSGNAKIKSDTVVFQTSDGRQLTIPRSKLSEAKKRDPKLKIVE